MINVLHHDNGDVCKFQQKQVKTICISKVKIISIVCYSLDWATNLTVWIRLAVHQRCLSILCRVHLVVMLVFSKETIVRWMYTTSKLRNSSFTKKTYVAGCHVSAVGTRVCALKKYLLSQQLRFILANLSSNNYEFLKDISSIFNYTERRNETRYHS